MPHAILLNRYGPPSVLTSASVELAALLPREVRIKTLFAGVNYTDLHIRSGEWPILKADAFPYVPGVEVVGTIEEVGTAVEEWKPGQLVITMMQGLGGVRAERPGGYAEFVTVDADVLANIPDGVAPVAMAALGLGAVTAFKGLQRLGSLSGKQIIVTGAAGGVGAMATAIAHASGAAVTAIIRRAVDDAYVRALGASNVVVTDTGKSGILPQSADGVLDTVAGELFGPCVRALRSDGVLSLVGAVGGGEVRFDAWDLLNPVLLTGYSTESLDGSALREAIAALSSMLLRGAIPVPNYQILPLAEAAEAHRLLENRQLRGRILLQP